jgi:small subunit ribosomal protein S6
LPPSRWPRGQALRVLKENQWLIDSTRLVYILPPDSTEEQVAELHAQIEGIITRLHGHIEEDENWGRRKLAYEIGPHKEGFYVLDVINASGELVKELDRRLKVFDQVIRHLIVRVDEEKKVVDRTPHQAAERIRAPPRQARPAAAAATRRRPARRP